MRLKWYGHSCFEIDGSKKVLIDPFITGNPKAKITPERLDPDILLITHGHEDHLGDSIDIAKRAKPKIGVIHEIAVFLEAEGIKAEGMNFYGTVRLDGVKVTLVPALHSSSYNKNYMGSAGGYIIEMDGVSIYHAGDTGIFKDMELIGEIYNPDIMLVPMGGKFTMGPEIAARAVGFVSPEVALPMHYGTFPFLEDDASKFKQAVEGRTKTRAVILESGEEYRF